MNDRPDGATVNYLAAAAADLLTRDAEIADVKCLLLFIDGLRCSLNNILAERLLDSVKNKKNS